MKLLKRSLPVILFLVVGVPKLFADSVSTWVDKDGEEHQVITKCEDGEKIEDCIKKHVRFVEAMKKLFPPKKG